MIVKNNMKNKIIIVIDKGCVQNVYSNSNFRIDVNIIDLDSQDEDDIKRKEKQLEEIEGNLDFKDIL
jgi:hypothetical protein